MRHICKKKKKTHLEIFAKILIKEPNGLKQGLLENAGLRGPECSCAS